MSAGRWMARAAGVVWLLLLLAPRALAGQEWEVESTVDLLTGDTVWTAIGSVEGERVSGVRRAWLLVGCSAEAAFAGVGWQPPVAAPGERHPGRVRYGREEPVEVWFVRPPGTSAVSQDGISMFEGADAVGLLSGAFSEVAVEARGSLGTGVALFSMAGFADARAEIRAGCWPPAGGSGTGGGAARPGSAAGWTPG